MGFGQAISTCFANYFNFQSRAARPEYWYFALFVIVVSILTAIADFVAFGATEIGPINGLFSLATLFPSLAVGARRLHDIGRSGWFLLLILLPIIGWIVLIYWACQPGSPGPNAYGPPPA
jgi:uncharacterized membrane protein YhaH (DUF805 family)